MRVRELEIGIDHNPLIKRALQVFQEVDRDHRAKLSDNRYSDVRLLVRDVAKAYRGAYKYAELPPALVAAVILDFCRQGYEGKDGTDFVDRVALDKVLDVDTVSLLASFSKTGGLTNAQEYLRHVPKPAKPKKTPGTPSPGVH